MFQPDKLADLLKPATAPEVKADPFTLESLIAWLRTKPAKATYCYSDNGHCLMAQYLKEVCGLTEPRVTPHWYREGMFGQARPLPHGFERVAHGGTSEDVMTYASALARAEKLLALGRAPNSLPYGDL